MSHRYQPPIDKDNETEEEEEASAEEAEEEELPEEVTPEEGVKQGFLDDPWPRMVFALMVLGFILVIFTPIDMWATYRYSLVGTYVFVILACAGALFAFKIWKKNPGSGLRWGGLFNGITISFCLVLGVTDSLETVFFGSGLFPGVSTPVFAIAIFVVVMCMYSVVLIDRSLKKGY
ncbi:MAG: hypothetical protein C4K47_05765 [Candidatus Thorarchaeota archaeon]|nr:MAG: hypothetical protein C4K47_05765 [Candidatus Thorarchaeota archaeon]